ncbi:ERG2/sigma1 receptor-like protein [Kockovaella imperatae]|uniref:C-8 sterol isomerase n=1 Tax=Kockovaella imperatae TaxID=4999 RepID=A0A1Y1UVE5_9TREE|nr:ERG2/sigma1 receptor-like protein [Kockovaella imperatae]ORX41185.1 ERG2/sigma1 receptor-like protein [Kockovaella imperatae]
MAGSKVTTQQAKSSGWSVLTGFIAVIVGILAIINTVDPSRFYVMQPSELHQSVLTALETAQASQTSAPGNFTILISTLIDQLVKDHPQASFATDFQDKREWVFNNAGGAMGSMFIIHASITEYLIIFGSAVGTEGHTGRHTADDYFHILTGQQTAYEAGELTKRVYNPGDVNLMERGVIRQYALAPETWALEYARGWIPPMLPFGFADSLSSTLDIPTMYHTVRITGREMIRNLLRGKI